MTNLPTGDRFICLDATALIHFAKIGKLDVLESLFPEAFTPEVVIEEEIRPHLTKYPANKKVLEATATWLSAVSIDAPATLELAASIHHRYGRVPGKDQGEADLVALCSQQDWTAIVDDTQGQRAARDYGVRYCSILTMILCAAAAGLLSPSDAWQLHRDIDRSRGGGRSALKGDDIHRPAFQECIEKFSNSMRARDLDWPRILALKGTEGLVVRVRNAEPVLR